MSKNQRRNDRRASQAPTAPTSRVIHAPHYQTEPPRRRPSNITRATHNATSTTQITPAHAPSEQSARRCPSDISTHVRHLTAMDIDSNRGFVKSESMRSVSPTIKKEQDEDGGTESLPVKEESEGSEDWDRRRTGRRRDERAPGRRVKVERGSDTPESERSMVLEVKVHMNQESTFLVRVQLEYVTNRGAPGSAYHNAPYRCSWTGNGSEVFRLSAVHASYSDLVDEINDLVEQTFQQMKNAADRDLNFELLERYKINALRVLWDYRVERPVEAFQPALPAGGGGTEVTEGNWRDVVKLLGKREGKDVLLLKHIRGEIEE